MGKFFHTELHSAYLNPVSAIHLFERQKENYKLPPHSSPVAVKGDGDCAFGAIVSTTSVKTV